MSGASIEFLEMELVWVRTIRKGNRPDLAMAAAQRESQIMATLQSNTPEGEKATDFVSSCALHSELLGFEICRQDDQTYRAHLLDSDVWGHRWSSASLAVCEGFEMASKAAFLEGTSRVRNEG